VSFKSPILRVWLPSRRSQLFSPRRHISAPHALGLRSTEPYSDLTARRRFPEADPPLRFLARPVSLTTALRRIALARSAAHPAPGLSRTGWSRCSLELIHLSGFPPLDLQGGVSPPYSPPVVSRPVSEETERRDLRDFLPTARPFPSFEGRWPVWRFRPTASAAPSEHGPAAAYFFSSKTPRPSQAGSNFS